MAPPLLQLSGIGLTFGGTPLLESAELLVSAGERVCLVGRNGSGKSTLLKIAAGLIAPDSGTRFMQPDATIRYLPQEPDLSAAATTLDYVESGLGPGDDRHRARLLLEHLGLGGEETPAQLSGGERRRAALAHVLAPAPDILLLDEPTNHLDLPAIEWLETTLRDMRAALVIISHDRRFLETLSRSTVWLDRGRTRRLEVGFGGFETWRDTVLAEEERDRHKLGRKIEAEEHWLRYGVTARRKRNERRLANLHALRREFRDARRATGAVSVTAAAADTSGALVIEADNIGKSFEGRPIVSGLTLRIQRGDRIGIVGPNGSGKTTLVRLLTGALPLDQGRVTLGSTVVMATLDQGRAHLNPDATLRETLTGGRGDTVMVAGRARHVIGYMQDFLFAPEQAGTPVRMLSGGERGRLTLACALAAPSNLLVLDEPTNDLDLETLDVLEEALGTYPGTVLLISHDRDFLDRAVNAVIAPDGKGQWLVYAGGYSDMLAQRGADIAAPTKAPQKSERATPAPRAPRAAAKRRLSFHEKHALETLPAQIAALEAEISTLQDTLAATDLFVRDRPAFETASRALAERQAELTAAEEKWLTLEILRQDIDGA